MKGPKSSKRSSKSAKILKTYDHSIFRLNISNIDGYGKFPITPKGNLRDIDVCPALDDLKSKVLEHLLKVQSQRSAKPTHWSVAWEVHPGSGLPHLDILIVYQRNVRPYTTSFDYLISDLHIAQSSKDSAFQPGHVWITPYSTTKFTKAVLDYGSKQDPAILTNITTESKTELLRTTELKRDPYRYLELQMNKDPLNFNVDQYVRKNDLAQYIPGWSSIKTKLKDMQVASANLMLKTKPGFKHIDRHLIESRLTPKELKIYDSWSGYQIIVDKLNQILQYKGDRDPKTLNLLITGPPNCGKSALVWHPKPHGIYNPISKYCSVYPIGMSQWFPKYQSDVYDCIYWNQMKLTSYSYDTILKLLDGSPLDLPNKGSVSRKVDNPLIIMTSNLTLNQMINQKFSYNSQYIKMAKANLAVRIKNVIVPKHLNLFLLQKLMIPKD